MFALQTILWKNHMYVNIVCFFPTITVYLKLGVELIQTNVKHEQFARCIRGVVVICLFSQLNPREAFATTNYKYQLTHRPLKVHSSVCFSIQSSDGALLRDDRHPRGMLNERYTRLINCQPPPGAKFISPELVFFALSPLEAAVSPVQFYC